MHLCHEEVGIFPADFHSTYLISPDCQQGHVENLRIPAWLTRAVGPQSVSGEYFLSLPPGCGLHHDLSLPKFDLTLLTMQEVFGYTSNYFSIVIPHEVPICLHREDYGNTRKHMTISGILLLH